MTCAPIIDPEAVKRRLAEILSDLELECMGVKEMHVRGAEVVVHFHANYGSKDRLPFQGQITIALSDFNGRAKPEGIDLSEIPW